ncbi:MAG: FAD-dependent oxidoreductase [Bacillota bacterium]
MIKKHEMVVIGGGPAGLGAAIEAARLGVEVLLVDENLKPGGQLFKQIHKFFGSTDHLAGVRGFEIGKRLLEEAQEAGVKVLLNTKAWGVFGEGVIGLEKDGQSLSIQGQRVLIATGASENALAFPGSTLPGVITAGAAQTMVNIHRVLPGKRILMVGSGNVGLIVSYQLLQAGASIVGIVEMQPNITGYKVHAGKIMRAGVPIYLSHTIKKARGNREVEEAVIAKVGEGLGSGCEAETELAVDTICLAVGLTPSVELALMCGCSWRYEACLGGVVPRHGRNMATSVPWLYVAGDAAGVEEASVALDEGRLAGISIAESLNYLSPASSKIKKEELWHRLNSLRGGPFGEKRYYAKEKLLIS